MKANALAGPMALAIVAIADGSVQAKPAKVDQQAPAFRVTTVTKQKIDLASLRGQVVVINRWATWCAPCREEFQLFEGYSIARAKYGFTVIAIETGGATQSGPMRKLAELVHFPVVLADYARADAYPVIDDGVPTNYIIDRAGIVRYAKAGEFHLAELDALVLPLLKEPAPATPSPDPAAK